MEANQHKDVQERKASAVTLPSSESSHIYALLKIDWPVAERVMVKLGALITSCSGGHPVGQDILQEIVERAVRAYGKTLYSGKNHKTPDHVRIGVFTDCLLQETYRSIQSGNVAVGKGLATIPGPASELELRKSLYELLVCDSLKRVLKEARFEETILDGRSFIRD